MQSSRLTNILLTVIATALVALAIQPYIHPAPVQAEGANPDPLYVEPGVNLIRIPNGGQVLGKIFYNLRTGNIYGFPTGSGDVYPLSPIDNKPLTSHAVLIGHFTVGEAR